MDKYTAVIVGVRDEEVMELSLLATYMAEEHYNQFFGRRQKEYMLENMQSDEAIAKAMEAGDRYLWIDSVPGEETESVMAMLDVCGYMSYGIKDDAAVIKNIYIMEEVQGRHLIRECVSFIESEVAEKDIHKLRIFITEGNRKAIQIFEHVGFTNKGKVVVPCGEKYKISSVELEKTF